MPLNTYALIATICASAALGLVAFLRAPDRPSNRRFAVHAFVTVAWAVATLYIQCSTDPATIEVLLRLVHAISAFIFITTWDFVNVFPNQLRPGPIRPRIFLYTYGLVLTAISMHPDLIRDVHITPQGPDFETGWPFILFGIGMLPGLTYVEIYIFQKARRLTGIARIQAIYVCVGSIASGAIIFGTNVVATSVTHSAVHAKWGVVGYLFTVAAMATAIAKHRLWDLSNMVRRAAAGILAIGIVTPGAIVGIWLAEHYPPLAALPRAHLATAAIIAGVLLGILVTPVYHAFRGLFSRALQEEREHIGKLLGALGAAIVHAPMGDGTLVPILTATQSFFNAEVVKAYLKTSSGEFRNAGICRAQEIAEDEAALLQSKSPRELSPDVIESLGGDKLAGILEVGQLLRFGALEEVEQRIAAMDALEANVIVPLRWQDETIGILVVGARVQHNMYGSSDIDLLRSVAAHAAIAARNAELRAAILSEKERTDKILSQMESGVVAADRGGIIHIVNPAACELLSMLDTEFLGKHIRVLPQPLRQHIHMALETGRTASGVRFYIDQERGLRVACSTLVIQNISGRREGAALVIHDLRTEDALRRAEQESERLQFVRAISAGLAHEIRNPLVAIRTFAELAPSRMDDPEFRDSFFQVAQSEIQRLEELVGQFMTLARPATIIKDPLDFESIFADATRTVSANAHSQDVTISTDVRVSGSSAVGDKERLHQALVNLLINALDATAPGGRIEVRAHQDGDDVVLTVWNSGSYIPPAERERLFEPFFTTKSHGTGLGLAICNTIADEHGGSTSVESVEGEGTAFIIRIPMQGQEASHPVLTP